ncbi:MAG: hypothetical protein CL596_04875 [Alteromonas sp.]|nr:hypothetical protein [Alteromonas sp.]|tara:strand:+ start:16389 stop:16667 length:279 start_codon:yes stop_codon:yes gene_type:complete
MKNTIYKNGYIINYSNGDRAIYRDKLEYVEDIEDKLYTIKQGDRLSSISFMFYKNPLLWYLIADINNIDNPFVLIEGQEIIIPNPSKYNLDG